MSTRGFMVTLAAGTALVLAAPAPIAESQGAAAPDDTEPVAPGTTAPAAAPTPNEVSIPEPTTVPPPEPTPEPATVPPPEPMTVLPPEPMPEPTTVPPPEPNPESTTGLTPELAPEGPTAPAPEPTSQSPTGPSPAAGNGGAVCFLTSAGLICPGPPGCVVTSTGVTCASNCIVTSAGLSCPRGEVLANPPVSAGPERTPTSSPGVKPERERKVGPTIGADVQEAGARELPTGAERLPFTGAPGLLWLGLGCGLLAGGLLLLRRISNAGAVAELAGEAVPLNTSGREQRD